MLQRPRTSALLKTFCFYMAMSWFQGFVLWVVLARIAPTTQCAVHGGCWCQRPCVADRIFRNRGARWPVGSRRESGIVAGAVAAAGGCHGGRRFLAFAADAGRSYSV